MKKIITVLLAITMITSLFLTACNKKTDDAVADVNGHKIEKAAFIENYKVYSNMYRQQFGDEALKQVDQSGKSLSERLKTNIVEKLIFEELMHEEAEKEKITVDDEEVNKKYQETIDSVGGKEKYEEFMKAQNLNEDFIKTSIRNEIEADKVKENYFEKNKISEDELQKYFDENKDNLVKYHIRHIMTDSDTKAMKIIDELKAGKDFKELATLESQDTTSAANGGDLGEVSIDMMPPEFKNAVLSTKVGSYSKIFKTEQGYHIVYVDSKKDSLNDLKDEVEAKVKDLKYKSFVEELRKSAKVEIYDLPKVEDDVKTEDKNTQEDKKGEDGNEGGKENGENKQNEQNNENNQNDKNNENNGK